MALTCHDQAMAKGRNPSGLPSGHTRVAKNRLSQGLERTPTAATAFSGFAAYVFGMLVIMASMFMMIAGLAMLVEGPSRVMGAGLLCGGAAAFTGGRWLMNGFVAQQAH